MSGGGSSSDDVKEHPMMYSRRAQRFVPLSTKQVKKGCDRENERGVDESRFPKSHEANPWWWGMMMQTVNVRNRELEREGRKTISKRM